MQELESKRKSSYRLVAVRAISLETERHFKAKVVAVTRNPSFDGREYEVLTWHRFLSPISVVYCVHFYYGICYCYNHVGIFHSFV